ncbi:MAG: DivIVA domain-containing protein [Streptococcaceae bacterium]|jgi:DivIVA domain-containing protein|nr:DivIVA domain-containing protein [Streptococcaceae bacterium]
MAQFKYTPREIYEMDFEVKMRGYNKEEVDEMLDGVIEDYENYAAELLRLQEENEFLKKRVADLEKNNNRPVANEIEQTQRLEAMQAAVASQAPTTQAPAANPFPAAQSKEPSNFELIKRINRLERAVFGTDSQFGAGSN